MRTLATGFVIAFVLTILSTCVAAAAAASTPAEQFVQQSADRAVAILKDKTLDAAARRAKLWDFLSSVLDLKRAALFALGSGAKSAQLDAISAYVESYTRFALANYVSEVDGYHGEVIAVTGSIPRNDNDIVVNANVLDPAAKPGAPPLAQVAFRVVKTDGRFAMVDASVMGIWFTIAQRDDFAGYLAQHGGDVKALAARLDAMAAKLRAGETVRTELP